MLVDISGSFYGVLYWFGVFLIDLFFFFVVVFLRLGRTDSTLGSGIWIRFAHDVMNKMFDVHDPLASVVVLVLLRL